MAISPRRAREIARTRQDILNAAARAFSSRGFAGATMQDIAREAGYTAASLYSYFSSKDEIIRGLFEGIQADREATFASPMPEGLTFRQKLELLMSRQLEVARRHRDTIRFFHFSGAGAGSHICGGCAENPAPFEVMTADLAAFFRAHATPEDLGHWEPGTAALAFTGLTHGFLLRWLRSSNDTDIGAGMPHLLDFFLGGLAASPQGNSK